MKPFVSRVDLSTNVSNFLAICQLSVNPDHLDELVSLSRLNSFSAYQERWAPCTFSLECGARAERNVTCMFAEKMKGALVLKSLSLLFK